MSETIVLLHGACTGSYSWDPIAGALESSGASVFAPDLIGYGRSPAPTGSYGIGEEVAHLMRLLDQHNIGTLHLVTHSFGSLIGLHLRRALGARVTRMTLIEPMVASVLIECREDDACVELEGQYQRFLSLFEDHEAAARFFVSQWSGEEAWELMGKRGRAVVVSLAPKLRLELTAMRSDTATLAWLTDSPPPTSILVGEKTHLAARAIARRLQPALRARTDIVPGAAHMIPITHPNDVIDIVRRDMSSVVR
jgi:pimeloyl-ACP methyl ester carboxylesterase